MEKKEFKIGEVFQFGLKTLQCQINPKTDDCCMCYFFKERPYCDEGEIGKCISIERKDKKDIIFVEKEE